MSEVTQLFLRGVIRTWLDQGQIDHALAARLLRLVDGLPELVDQVNQKFDVRICPRTSADDHPNGLARPK